MGDITMSPAEVVWAMLILLTVLIIVTFFFCLLPVYRALQARWTHWEDPENDPRWNVDQFQFSPTSPRLYKDQQPKYNRLSTCSNEASLSRGSSFRNNCVLPRLPDQIEIQMPPAYADLYKQGTEPESPPAYYSRTPSENEVSEKAEPTPSQDAVTEAEALPEPKPLKKVIRKNPKGKQLESRVDGSNQSSQQAEAKTTSGLPTTTAPPPALQPANEPTPVPSARPRKTFKKVKSNSNPAAASPTSTTQATE